jgi:hypothetical protein
LAGNRERGCEFDGVPAALSNRASRRRRRSSMSKAPDIVSLAGGSDFGGLGSCEPDAEEEKVAGCVRDCDGPEGAATGGVGLVDGVACELGAEDGTGPGRRSGSRESEEIRCDAVGAVRGMGPGGCRGGGSGGELAFLGEKKLKISTLQETR